MSVITQVQRSASNTIDEKKSKQHLPSLLSLSLRGTRVDIDKETLLALPESLLVVMFPHGFVLDGQEDNKPYCTVDFNLECLNYVLEYFQKAKEDFKSDDGFAQDAYLAHAVASGIPLNPLLTKQAIVVLREELEFFLVVTENNQTVLSSLKQKSGEFLVTQDLVFEALLKNIDKQKNIAEHHLVDMLCNAGFSKTDHWNHRSTEPNKTCVSSLSLVCLSQPSRLKVGKKLIVFWRKPARKCWWTKSIVNIENEPINLWCRRTWTLELILL